MNEHNAVLEIDGDHLSIPDVVAVARAGRPVAESLSPTARAKVEASRAWVDNLVREGRYHAYGINTGFGIFSNRHLEPGETELLTRNLILSHTCGVSSPLPDDVVRATMLIRANTLAKGYSGVRPVVIETLLKMLNRRVHPVMPSMGSLGASGDLAPLSHLALVLSAPLEGESAAQDPFGYAGGRARFGGREMTGAEAMAAAGLPRLQLLAKEGLALNNGATVSAAMAALVVHDAVELVKHAEIALAMSLEAVRGTLDAFHVLPHRVRNHRGQQASAANVRRLARGSELAAHGPQEETIHDAYSLRCGPQVLGAVRDVLRFVWDTITDEINAATDNPLLFVDDPELDPARVIRAISCGNFHGEPVAFALDFLSIALTELASIAERRLFRLTDNMLSRGLPLMLLEVDKAGLNSGMMIAQYTAAALVSECKTLAHPDSVDSIPSSADWEDHVSMSMNAGLHALKVLENARYVVAIEMLCAAQALDFRLAGLHFWREEPWRKENGKWRKDVCMYKWETEPLAPGVGTRAAYETIRAAASKVEQDRPLHPDIERIAAMIADGTVLRAVEAAIGAPLLGIEITDQAALESAG